MMGSKEYHQIIDGVVLRRIDDSKEGKQESPVPTALQIIV